MGRSEYMSKDIMDESLLRTFAPYHHLQFLLGSCRVHAKSRFVTAPSRWQKAYTTIAILTCAILYYKVSNAQFRADSENESSLKKLYILFISVQVVISFCNIIHVRFINGSDNVKFFIKMQKIDRLMKIDRDPTFNTILFKANLSSVAFLILIFVPVVIVGVTESLLICGMLTIVGIVEAPLYLDITQCSNLIFYFAMRVRFVNNIILNHLEEEYKIFTLSNSNQFFSTFYADISSKRHDFKSSETDLYLREIIRGFNVYNDLYRFQILLFCTKMFLYTLLTFEYAVLAIKYNHLDFAHAVLFGTITFVDFIGGAFLCIRFEIFFKTVKKMKSLAITVMSIYLHGPLREKAKVIYNIIEEMPPCFSVYDMWQMEARIILTIINIITSFIVTLLQFAIL